MKYYISNTDLDKQIDEIRLKIRLSMNGVVADQLTKNGIKYKKNFGVSIPRIKQIALGYSPNHDLAQRLWQLNIRETMILATLLEPTDKFTIENAKKWANEIIHIELVEQCCMNLFNKLSFSNNLCCNWINSDQLWIQICGYVLTARIYTKLKNEEISFIIGRAIENIKTEEYHLYKAIALCLGRCCRINSDIAELISLKLNDLDEKDTFAYKFILGEVKQEILFLKKQ